MAHKCVKCGEMENNRYVNPTMKEMEEQQICFHCHFWMEKVGWRKSNDPRAVIVNGRYYYIDDEAVPGYQGFRGFGGSEFKIKFNDGREVISHNLWCQGDIPAHFRDVLTDNAVFIK